jgi:hypothetical protein
VREASGYVRQQVFQTVRLRVKNDYCDISTGQILLVFDTLIHGKENVEFGCFRGDKEVAILQSSESGATGRLAIVTGQLIPESLVDALLNQNAHLGTRKQEVLCFFEGSDSRFARGGRKSL